MSRSLKIDFAPFVKLIHETLKQMKRVSNDFNREIEETTKINLVDLFKKNLEISTRHDDCDDECDDDLITEFGFHDHIHHSSFASAHRGSQLNYPNQLDHQNSSKMDKSNLYV